MAQQDLNNRSPTKCASDGWPHHLSDEEILERLLALNL
jgi:hypothetical protein